MLFSFSVVILDSAHAAEEARIRGRKDDAVASADVSHGNKRQQ